MSTVLAFDLGASTGRAIRCTYDGKALHYIEIHRFPNTPVYEDGHLCWNFPYLLQQVKNAIAKCESPDSLSFDTWGVDYGLLDQRGELLGLPIHYRDARNAHIPEQLSTTFLELYRATGNQIMPINTLFQLLTESRKDASVMLFMPDLFAWALCGAVSTERSIASTSQLLDPTTGNWSTFATALTGFDFFPQITDSATVCGTYKGIKIVKAAGHDTQCAVAAIPYSCEDGSAFLSCGTWSLIGCELSSPILTERSMRAGLSNELGADGKINYLKNISGLWLIQELRRDFNAIGKTYSYNDMELLAREVPAFTCLIDPDAPQLAEGGNMSEKIRAFCRRTRQPPPESDGALIRCVYESLAMKYRYALEQIRENTGRQFSALHIVGGGAKDSFLCQTAADCLNIPVIAGPVEATALGNILLQLIALGDISDLEHGRALIRMQEKLSTFTPKTRHECPYERFLDILYEQELL